MSNQNGNRKVTRNLKCILTPDEVRGYGQELAKANACKDDAEQRKKEVDAQLKAEIESHETRGLSLARKINNGYEYRDVECETRFDVKKATARTYRMDTNELIEERAMTPDELQTKLELEPSKA